MLGIADTDDWAVVRAAYRRLIRDAHPDKAGRAATGRAARLNEAYAVLSRAKRAGTLTPAKGTASSAKGTVAREPAPPSVGVAVIGSDTLLLAAPPHVAFAWLLEVAHGLGAVSYVDRSCGIFEVIVRHRGRIDRQDESERPEGETCSLLVMLEPRSHGTKAVLAVESLERAASHSPEPFVRRLAAAVG